MQKTYGFINDCPSSTVEQIFVHSCKAYTPANPLGPNDSNKYVGFFTCEDCGDRFLYASSLSFHVNRYSVAIEYKCNECSSPLTFYNRCNFLAHLRLHNLDLSEEELGLLDITSHPIPKNEIVYTFNLSSFTANSEIGSNGSSDAGKINRICLECCKFVNKNGSTGIRKHYLGSNGIGSSLSCSFCQLLLPTSCSLKAHLRNHKHQSPFICPDCGVQYPSSTSLTKHFEETCLHTYKIVRYKCIACQSLFKDARTLCRHMMLQHLELKSLTSYMCHVCEQAVAKQKFVLHVRDHSLDISASFYSYQCRTCSYSTPKKSCFFPHKFRCAQQKLNKTLALSKNSHSDNAVTGQTDTYFNLVNNLTVPCSGDEGSNRAPFQVQQVANDIIPSRLPNRYNNTSGLDVIEMPLTPSPEPIIEDDEIIPSSEPNHSDDGDSYVMLEETDPLSSAFSEQSSELLFEDKSSLNSTSSNNLICNMEPCKPKRKYNKKSSRAKAMKLNLSKLSDNSDITHDPLKQHFAARYPDNTVTVNTKNKLVVSPVKRIKLPVIYASKKVGNNSTDKDGIVRPADRQFKAISFSVAETAGDSIRSKTSLTTNVADCSTVKTDTIIVKREPRLLQKSSVTEPSTNGIKEKRKYVKKNRLQEPANDRNKRGTYKKRKTQKRTNWAPEQGDSWKDNEKRSMKSRSNKDVTMELDDGSETSSVQRRGRREEIKPSLEQDGELMELEIPEEQTSSDESSAPDVNITHKRRKRNVDPDFVCNHPAYRAIIKRAKKNTSKVQCRLTRKLSNKKVKMLMTKESPKQNARLDSTSKNLDSSSNRGKAQEIPFTDPEVPCSKFMVERRGRKKLTDHEFRANAKLKSSTGKLGRPPKRKYVSKSPSKVSDSDLKCDSNSLGCGIVISPTKNNTDDSFTCSATSCHFVGKDKEIFKAHILKHRTDKSAFQCMECGLFFVVKPTFTKHLFINHRIYDVDAYIKDNDCCDKDLLDQKIDESGEEKKVLAENVPTVLLENQCKICYKICDDALNLNIHFRTHGMAFLRQHKKETTLPLNASESTEVNV